LFFETNLGKNILTPDYPSGVKLSSCKTFFRKTKKKKKRKKKLLQSYTPCLNSLSVKSIIIDCSKIYVLKGLIVVHK